MNDTDARGDGDAGVERDSILYMIRVRCPSCDEIQSFVEEVEKPIALDQDVSLSAEWCPYCSFWVAGESCWDRVEEVQIERVVPTQEREGTLDAY